MALLLVSDSDATVREPVAQALRLRGHRVRCASDASVAAEIVRQRPQPDMIVLGVEAPESHAGRSFWEPLRRAIPGVPVVVCSTGHIPPLDDLEGADVVAWFAKPIHVGRLLDFVDVYVSGRRFATRLQ